MSKRTVVTASLIALLLAGCGRSHDAASNAPVAAGGDATTPAETATDTSQCGVYLSGANVRVLVAPGSDDECSALAKQFSADGSFWTVRPQAVDDGLLTLVCAMKKDSDSAYVEDTGSAMYGRQLCSNFLSQGWNEDTAAENQAANNAAAASASAASAAQLAKDEDSAAQLVASLQAVPSKLSDDLKTMDGHVQQALDDLSKTKADAAKGQGDDCYNVQTVAYDASSDVGYDATNDVGYDATNDVGYTIGQARDDLASLQNLTQQITAANGILPAGATAANSDATSAIALAIAQANADIDKANAAAASAYKIAADLATGSCNGYASEAFQPVQHIS